jgi:hypothetical protein
MPWVLHNVSAGSPLGDEVWKGFELPIRPDVRAYGFRLSPPASPYPSSWQFTGYWAICSITSSAAQVSPVQSLSSFNNPLLPCLTVIGTEQVVETPEAVTGLFVLVSVNRWIPDRDVEVWLLL